MRFSPFKRGRIAASYRPAATGSDDGDTCWAFSRPWTQRCVQGVGEDQQPSDEFASDSFPTPFRSRSIEDFTTSTRHSCIECVGGARVLSQLRANLQRPVSGRQALEWRLRVGWIEPLANRWFVSSAASTGATNEALLHPLRLPHVLREVSYNPRLVLFAGRPSRSYLNRF